MKTPETPDTAPLLEFDLPTSSENRRRKLRQIQAAGVPDYASDPMGFIEYSHLKDGARLDTLQGIAGYSTLLQLLKSPNKHQGDIVTLIRQIRGEFFTDPLFADGKVTFLTSKSEFDDYQKTRLTKHQELINEHEEGIGLPYAWHNVRMSYPEYPAKPQWHIGKLYHWVPNSLAEKIMQQGLLPGFLAERASGGRAVAHASFQRNEHWNNLIAHEASQVGFTGEYTDPSAYTELEIDYDASLDAYMRPPVLKEYPDYSLLISETAGSHTPLLSTSVVPLDAQVSLLLNFDQQQVDTTARVREDDMFYSPLLDRNLPFWASSQPQSYASSEVLLDYVPPERIHVAS